MLCRFRTIEYNIEIENIPKLTADFGKIITLLSNLCEKSSFNKTCQYVIDELNYLMTAFKNKYMLMESANVESAHNFRKKREILDVIRKSITLSDYAYSDLKQSTEQLTKVVQQILSQQNKTTNFITQTEFSAIALLT